MELVTYPCPPGYCDCTGNPNDDSLEGCALVYSEPDPLCKSSRTGLHTFCICTCGHWLTETMSATYHRTGGFNCIGENASLHFNVCCVFDYCIFVRFAHVHTYIQVTLYDAIKCVLKKTSQLLGTRNWNQSYGIMSSWLQCSSINFSLFIFIDSLHAYQS